MLPCQSFSNRVNTPLSYSKMFLKLRSIHLFGIKKFSYLYYLICREYCPPMVFSYGSSILINTVTNIIGLSAKKKMIWVYAGSFVAFVKNLKFFWYSTLINNPRRSMSKTLIFKFKYPVSVFLDKTFPLPTSILKYSYKSFKSFFWRSALYFKETLHTSNSSFVTDLFPAYRARMFPCSKYIVHVVLMVSLNSLIVNANDIVVTKFCGINTADNAASIDDCEAQDGLNFNITPGGKSVYKRDGYGLDKTLTISTSATHGMYYAQDLSGSDIQLVGSDLWLYGSLNHASFVQLATGTINSTWQCTDNSGYAYCVTSNRDMAVRTSGTSATTTFQNGIPRGTMVTATPDRLVVSGVSGNESVLYFSQANTFTNFTTGVNSADPFYEYINSPGSRITHIRYACGKVLWWKDASFGYSVGSDQYNLENVTISQNIGTLDNSSDEYNGHVYFRGQDSHIYDYDCSNVTRLSRQITPTVQTANRRRANSWTQTSQAELGSGYLIGTSTTSLSGSITLGRLNDSFSDLSKWTQNSNTINSDWGPSSTTFVVSGGFAYPDRTNTNNSTADMYSIDISSISNNWRMKFNYQYEGSGIGTCNIFVSTSALNGRKGYGLAINSILGNHVISISGPDISNATGSATHPSDTSIHSLELVRSSTGYMLAYYDNVSTITLTDNTYTQFKNIRAVCSSANPSAGVAKIRDFYLSSSTGTYISSVNNAPSITSWNTFGSNDQSNDGVISYFVRVDTAPFTVLSSTPQWRSQSKNSTVNYSTGTYMQMKADFSITSATQTPTINDFSFSWYEGSAADKVYIKYWNDYVWISVSSGTSGLNNRILRWDLLNQTWLLDDIASNGFLVDNGQMYFGSPTEGKTFKYGNGLTTDNSGPINAFWKSKNFTGNDPFVQNNYELLDFVVAQASGTTLSTYYQIDGSTSTAVNFNLYDNGKTILHKGRNLQGKVGTFVNVQFGDNSSNPKFDVMGVRIRYSPLAWRPN